MCRGCDSGYICLPNIGENPNYGFMNFDNILWSALITFQLMTIDFWENAYRKVSQIRQPVSNCILRRECEKFLDWTCLKNKQTNKTEKE